MAIKDGGPAYPAPEFYDEKVIGCTPGASLRDHFAGQALMGYLAHFAHPQSNGAPSHAEAAREAYAYADAMLAQRETGSR